MRTPSITQKRYASLIGVSPLGVQHEHEFLQDVLVLVDDVRLKLLSVDIFDAGLELGLFEPGNEVGFLEELGEGVVAEGRDDGFDVEADGGTAVFDLFANFRTVLELSKQTSFSYCYHVF